ncbi:Nif3-like dinuclear metal center hexameric protein [soil metagenome]
MLIRDLTNCLENFAPLSLQEDYDNAGLITGDANFECTGALTTLDVTEAVIDEAIESGCNLIVAHHPVIFRGIKKFSSNGHVERTIIHAIKNDMAIYAIHTNLDNVIKGVNKKIADKLGLENLTILSSKEGSLKKLVTFCPESHIDEVRNALFLKGGKLGNYKECSFNVSGTGTFKPEEGADPFVGKPGTRHYEKEIRIEVIFPSALQHDIISDLRNAHPYEEVAYDIYSLDNKSPETGSGLTGTLPELLNEEELLNLLKTSFNLKVIKHTTLLKKNISKVALCGGAGSFLLKPAIQSGADAFITGDVKYHEFFEADSRILLLDIGHFESEQLTIGLLADILKQNFPNFAVLKTRVNTNPVNYFS